MGRGRGQGAGESSLRVIAQTAEELAKPSLRIPSHERNKIIYIREHEELNKLVEGLKDIPILALDIETAGVRGYGVENGAPRTIQLGGQTKNWYKRAGVVDVKYVDPSILFPLLKDPDVEIVIHNADFEQVWLDFRYNVRITNIFDTKIAARIVRRERAKELKKNATSLHDLKLSTIARIYTQEEMDKEEQDSWWGRPDLEPGQIAYAAKDVDVPLRVARKLKALAIEYGVLDEIYAECEKIYPRCHRQVLNMKDRKDDYFVGKLLLENAETLEELEQAQHSITELPLYHTSVRKLKYIYRSRQSALQGK